MIENFIVLAGYATLLLLIAFKSFTKIKSHSDFFIAGKNGTIFAITGSLVATILGGSAIIGSINEAPKMEWAISWFMICAALGLFAVIPFTKRIHKLGRYTLPDLLETLHGKYLKFISSCIIPVAWVGIIAAQIIAAAKILQSFVGIDYNIGAIASGLLFIVYTLAGGQFSILKTDVIQAIFVLIGLIVISIFVSVYSAKSQIEIPIGGSFFNENFSLFNLIVLILTYSTTFTTGPDIFSRLFCAKNQKTIMWSLLISGFTLIIVALMIGYIGMSGISFGLAQQNGLLLVNICKLVLPTWAVSIIVIALLSAVLSSADTTILSASIIATDLIQHNKFNHNTIKITRISIFAIGIISIAISLVFKSIIEILLFALAIYAGAFTLPILLGLMGHQFKSKYISAAVLVGGGLALTGKLVSFTNIQDFSNLILIGSFVVSGIMLFIGRVKK